MKLFTGIFTLLVGLLISAVAGYFSIVGLAALFAAAGVSILIMGASLEVGKLVAASWLKVHWSDKTVPLLHKAYLLIAVAVLMVITSIGIYGFLAAGHLEQKAPLAGISIQANQLESRLQQYQSENDRLLSRLNQIDQNINSFITQGAASRGLSASQTLQRERDQLSQKIDQNNSEINKLNEQLIPLKTQSSTVEAKLGPVKYLSQLIGYGDSPEVAVQMVILLIMIPFDPLAVVLVLSGMISINQWRSERKKAGETKDVVEEFDVSYNGPISLPSEVPDIDEIIVPNIDEIIEPESESAVEASETKEAVEPTPIVFEMVQPVPVQCSAEAVVVEPEKTQPTPDQTSKRTISREEILDLLEDNPTFVNEMISAIMNTIEPNKKATPSDLTGARIDD